MFAAQQSAEASEIMRPLAVLLLATVVFGGLAAYSRFAATSPIPWEEPEIELAEGEFELELTLTFTAERDEFSFEDSPPLLVRTAGRDLLRRDDVVKPNEPIRITLSDNLVAGKNALFVRAVPSSDDIVRPCAVRVRLLRDGIELAEETFWSEPGGVVAGEVLVDVGRSTAPAHEEH